MVTNLTRLFMGDVNGWYIHCKPINMYRWKLCLGDLRKAALFVARLRAQGMDMHKAKNTLDNALTSLPELSLADHREYTSQLCYVA